MVDPSSSRRRMLTGALALPLAAGVLGISARLRTTAGGLRPAGRGTSVSRCALCGAREHHMLDPGCPAAPQVL